MKHRKSLLRRVLLTIGILLPIIYSCEKHKSIPCETNAKGRIIGYDPCRYYNPITHREDAGFVIEIDNGISKDTAINYSIPGGLFEFPYISDYTATIGQFLYAPDIQNKFKIKFNYRLALENEKTAVPCKANINTALFNAAVKGKEIFMTCISSE
jgi:hypothetical protein